MGSRRISVAQAVAANLDRLMNSHAHLATQQKLAARSGVGQSTVGRVRRGELSTTIGTLEALAKPFGLTASDLLAGAAAEPPAHSPQVLRLAEKLAQLPAKKLVALEVLLESDAPAPPARGPNAT